MTELRENCTWRRCGVSRARFRLKLYEPAVKMSRRCRASWNSWYLRPLSARLKYFYPDAKGVLSQSFSLIRHSSRSVYVSPRLFLSFFPPGELSLCYSRRFYISRDKSRSISEVKIGKFATFDKSPFLATLAGGRDIFTLRILHPSQIYIRTCVRCEDISSGKWHLDPLRGNTDRLGVPYSSSNDRNSSSFFILFDSLSASARAFLSYPRFFIYLPSYALPYKRLTQSFFRDDTSRPRDTHFSLSRFSFSAVLALFRQSSRRVACKSQLIFRLRAPRPPGGDKSSNGVSIWRNEPWPRREFSLRNACR